MNLRLFVALAVPGPVRAALAASLEAARRARPDLRWTDPGGWHVTLAFLGWVDDARLGDVHAAVRAAATAATSFEIALDGRAGTFGGRVLWAGLAPSAPLEALVTGVRAALVQRGLPAEDRPFRPHLTLARAGRGRTVPAAVAQEVAVPAGAWRVRDVRVLRSHLGREGARYEVLARCPLGGERD